MTIQPKPHAAPVLDGDPYGLITARSGKMALTADVDGRQISLHSRFDPEREAAGLVKGLSVRSGQGLVILGLALGWHLAAALAVLPDEARVTVVEADERLAELARRHFPESLSDPRVRLVAGLEPETALARVREHLGDGPALLVHPPSLRLRPEYYGALQTALGPDEDAGSVQTAGGPLIRTARKRVVLFDTGYFLVREVKRTLAAMGHEVLPLRVNSKGPASRDVFRRTLHGAAARRPDFILTINHFGFDNQGALDEALDRLGLPWASWFVDSPIIILKSTRSRGKGSIFLWDEDYEDEVRAMGYENVHYLPLGTDDTIFRPGLVEKPKYRTSFIGDSMTSAVIKKIHSLKIDPRLIPEIDRAAAEYARDDERTPARAMKKTGLADAPEVRAMDADRFVELMAFVTWRATQEYRLEMVRALAPFEPVVAGDPGWQDLLDPSVFRLLPRIDYYHGLPWFYSASAINLNATSLQMKTGLNQRIFDVPACGAFLLTDYRRQIERLFEPGREVVCYQGAGELADLARYYLDHEKDRASLARAARRRVLAEHTYQHRLTELIRRMKQDHGT